MFTFAVPDTQHADRSREYLKNNWIDFEENKDDDGYTHISFPGVGECEFEKFVIKLKNQGVTMIGVDTALTEKKIMKLAKLLESPLYSFEENNETSEEDVVSQIKELLKDEDGTLGADPTSKFWMAIADCIGDYDDRDDVVSTSVSETKEDKVRKVIRKIIRQ